jgi:hypothetical protein
MHPGYFTTHFREHDEIVDWPQEFVVISAYATTGETWPDVENERADEALAAALTGLGVWAYPVLGFSTESDHAEPSWAACLSLDAARALGRRFRQYAIFHVLGDHLSVTRCEHGASLVPIGSFRERLHGGLGPRAGEARVPFGRRRP